MLISPVVFPLFLILIFWPVMGRGGGVKGQILSAVLRISGTIHHMIAIHSTLAYNDTFTCFFYFFKILNFWVVRRVKGQKMVQNEK